MITTDDVMKAVERREITPRVGLYMIVVIRFNEMYPWPLPEDPFDMSGWLDVLTPEQRDALEAICTR